MERSVFRIAKAGKKFIRYKSDLFKQILGIGISLRGRYKTSVEIIVHA